MLGDGSITSALTRGATGHMKMRFSTQCISCEIVRHDRLVPENRCVSASARRCVAAAGLLPARALAQTAVDLELVIAVDVSLSMDLDEQRLQRRRLHHGASAIPRCTKPSPRVPNGRIAVTYMEWAGPPTQQVVMPWTMIDGPAGSARLRRPAGGRADLARPHDLDLRGAVSTRGACSSQRRQGIRRVIDVSGDGPNNAGVPVVPVRDELVAKGIVINGLPIVLKLAQGFFDLAELDLYYADCVIGGTGAFMIPIKERSEFQTATRRKLLLEIAGYEPPARLIRAQATAPAERFDCLVGEKQCAATWTAGFELRAVSRASGEMLRSQFTSPGPSAGADYCKNSSRRLFPDSGSRNAYHKSISIGNSLSQTISAGTVLRSLEGSPPAQGFLQHNLPKEQTSAS